MRVCHHQLSLFYVTIDAEGGYATLTYCVTVCVCVCVCVSEDNYCEVVSGFDKILWVSDLRDSMK